MSEKTFAAGMSVERHENAPEFVTCKLGINVETFADFMHRHKKPNGWINIQVKRSKGGKYYAELDEWEPDGKSAQNPPKQSGGPNLPDDDFLGDIPFAPRTD